MNRFFVYLFCLSLLYGCATRPISNDLATSVPTERILESQYASETENSIQVVVKRDDGFGGSGCTTRVFVDAVPVADLEVAEKVVLHVPIGKHILGAEPTGICGMGRMAELQADIGKDSCSNFRIGWDSNGHFFISPTAF